MLLKHFSRRENQTTFVAIGALRVYILFLCIFQVSKIKYRSYSTTSMMNAIEVVRGTGEPIKTTAREYGILEAYLRNKLSGRVNPEATGSGPSPMISQEEAGYFVEHLKFMVICGYDYSRSGDVDNASEYAVCLNKRISDHPLSLQ